MIEPVILGDCTLYCGDCLNADIEPNSIDLTVTSPPYDNLRTYNGSLSAFKFEPIAQMLYRVTKPGGVVVWVVGDETNNGSESGNSFRQALYFMELGFYLHDTMIYEKDTPPSNNKRYQSMFEFMFVFSKGKINTTNLIEIEVSDYLLSKQRRKYKSDAAFQREKGGEFIHKNRIQNTDKRIKGNIWYYRVGFAANDDLASNHPAIFPEQLAKDHILSWSNPGDVIFDPMMGSGTTGKMATKYQRKFVGCEVNTEYFEIAVKRIKQAQLQIRMEI